MKTILTLLLLSIFHLADAKKVDPPQVGIELAIEMAKNYVRRESIQANEDYTIVKVEFINMYNEYELTYWRIRWERIPAVKGGWFEVRVFQNSDIEVKYGE
ncbi:hypothetical protein QWI17_20510 [Gilvimarinus sp. SDUM040013]|uniref:Uncharacterized protein n=1 Tax=Gilvimarinus gilvus TaxID=3058038 RepID=A0ABU4RU64_9GAMM|nr:hypothetical protein [Gilvimarinus sp. SDUM040013]MDO3388241.1 hypothetical protein [Gilvimarinus sp. SDUM040013]MDX6847791.1 hypothetical protein [Gilvimarinus sp. SDUM040013]